MSNLTVVIPARNEEFLKLTVEDILKNSRADTKIIVGLDGEWAKPALDQHPNVSIVYYPESIGQRAITNACVRLAKSSHIMKVDAHCAFDEGFDAKMLQAFDEEGDNLVMVPLMRNLHIFDWKCPKCGLKIYQDREPVCPTDGTRMRKKILWRAKESPKSTAYCFDSEPHFQYHSEQRRKQVGTIVETMSLQGSCFMCTKSDYERLNICDEAFGSWGSQGIEVACKFWLSGGRVLSNTNTWYAHCFRTKPNFSFPYDISGRQVQNAKRYAKEQFFEAKWPGMTRTLSWLVEKFRPVPGWTEEEISALKSIGN